MFDGGARPGGTASTVVDLTAEPPVVLREGPVAADAVMATLAPLRGASSER